MAVASSVVRRLRRLLVLRTIFVAGFALLLAWIVNRLHARYTCDPSVNAIWPAQVIFGFYLVILGLCVQALEPAAKAANPEGTGVALRRLFLLVLTGLCLDLVFVNYAEAQKDEPGFYRLVVLWDFFVFFAWLRAIDLAKDAPLGKFLAAPLVAIAPLLKLGRELLFVPYWAWETCAKTTRECPPGQSVWADLVFGDLAVCFWLFVILGRLAHPVLG